MRHGFQLVDFAAYRGDLGRVRMTYLSNQARFAAAWAIIVTVRCLFSITCACFLT